MASDVGSDVRAAQLRAAAVGAGPSSPFGIAYLQLCEVSYLKDPWTMIDVVKTSVTPLDPGGQWTCDWGPAQNADHSNLVFVAVYRTASGTPVCAVTVVRGTDADIGDRWGVLEQIWEDIDILNCASPPWDPAGEQRVAQGTLDALDVVEGLRANAPPVSLRSFLTSFLSDPANGNPVLVVTGHSLGGCLVSVVAPWLRSSLAAAGVTNTSIVPASFAAPTAGNAAFAAWFDATFTGGMRVHNSLDVVPLGWWNLKAVKSIYETCGHPTPEAVKLVVDGWDVAMAVKRVSYAQPAADDAPLTGACAAPASASWTAELAYQHHPTTYMALLGGKSIPGA